LKQKQLKILSVEDDNIIGEMIIIMLNNMGHEAVSAENGVEALEIYNEELEAGKPFDLVISDLGMAGMDGITLSKELKKINPNIPFILLTGFSAIVRQEDMENLDYILNKPVVMDELNKTISEIMNGKS